MKCCAQGSRGIAVQKLLSLPFRQKITQIFHRLLNGCVRILPVDGVVDLKIDAATIPEMFQCTDIAFEFFTTKVTGTNNFVMTVRIMNPLDFVTEGLGSRIPQQDCQRIEKSRMEFSYSAGVSCSINVASLFLIKMADKCSSYIPTGRCFFASRQKEFQKSACHSCPCGWDI